jgi:nicotinamide phosphoribosyltransferase
VFGMGGKLLQADINRDTQNFATKACFAVVNGEHRDLVKSPTEVDENGDLKPSFKKSKQGRLKLVKDYNDYTYSTVTSLEDKYVESRDELRTIFEDGKLLIETPFEDIRSRARIITLKPILA